MKKLTKSTTPTVKVISTKENSDGSLDIEIEYNEDWEKVVKMDLKKKRLTEKDISNHLTSLLEKAVSKKDGYDIKKLND